MAIKLLENDPKFSKYQTEETLKVCNEYENQNLEQTIAKARYDYLETIIINF